MKYQKDCIECSKNLGRRIFRIGLDAHAENGSEEVHPGLEGLNHELETLIDQADPNLSPADLSFLAIRAGEKHSRDPDPFKVQKQQHNRLALSLFDDLKQVIQESEDPLHTACLLSACGNIIDLGTQEQFDIQATIQKVLNEGFKIDHFDRMIRIFESKIDRDEMANVVYLCDNAGEIVFDRLFIEQLFLTYPHLEITAVVNQGPVLNDATMQDAVESGLDRVIPVMDNGTHDLGTVLSNVSREFWMVYENADVILSKGQANYETLSDRDEPIFFILKAKCDVIAKSLGVNYLDAVMVDKDYVHASQKAAFG